jgi:hypothetical protein
MKLYLITVLSLLVHGGNVSIFTLTKTNNEIYITVDLEIEDIKKAFQTSASIENDSLIVAYLKSHTAYYVNEKKVELINYKVTRDQHHISIQAVVNKVPKAIETLKIENTVLFETSKNHSNIIKVRLDDNHRDFLINAARPILNLNL